MKNVQDTDLFDNNRIVRALQRKEEEVFDKFYCHYYPLLCGYASRMVTLDVAEEIVQDVFVWIWTHADELQEELSVKGLLFRMVHNKALNVIDHEKTQSALLQDLELKMSDQLENLDSYERKELLHLYNNTLNKLSPSLREAFLLSRENGYTHHQIADLLGVSPQLINYRISQTMKVLRLELKDFL